MSGRRSANSDQDRRRPENIIDAEFEVISEASDPQERQYRRYHRPLTLADRVRAALVILAVVAVILAYQHVLTNPP